jgi:hypothetical protein
MLPALSDSLSHARTRSAQGARRPRRVLPEQPNGSARRSWRGSRAGAPEFWHHRRPRHHRPSPCGHLDGAVCRRRHGRPAAGVRSHLCGGACGVCADVQRGASRRPSVRRTFPTSGRRVPLQRAVKESSVDAGQARAVFRTARYNPGRQTGLTKGRASRPRRPRATSLLLLPPAVLPLRKRRPARPDPAGGPSRCARMASGDTEYAGVPIVGDLVSGWERAPSVLRPGTKTDWAASGTAPS